MKKDILEKIEEKYKKVRILWGDCVDADEVESLEKKIGFSLPEIYKEFVRRFGGGIVGPFSIIGLRRAEVMGIEENSAIDVTMRFRSQGWEGTESWLVVSVDHCGNPIGIDRDGKVWISDHDFGGVTFLQETFRDYLEYCFYLLSDIKHEQDNK